MVLGADSRPEIMAFIFYGDWHVWETKRLYERFGTFTRC